MNKIMILLSLGLFLFISCEKSETDENLDWTNKTNELLLHNKDKVSITEGAWGTLVKTEGNCMPIIDYENGTCKQYPVQSEILIYKYTKTNETLSESSKFYEIYTELVATTTCDKEGFFEMILEPRKYSVFVREGEYLYANSFDGLGGVSPVVVEPSNVSEIKLNLDYAVY